MGIVSVLDPSSMGTVSVPNPSFIGTVKVLHGESEIPVLSSMGTVNLLASPPQNSKVSDPFSTETVKVHVCTAHRPFPDLLHDASTPLSRHWSSP